MNRFASVRRRLGTDVQGTTEALVPVAANVFALEMNRQRVAFACLIVGGAINLVAWLAAALLALRMLS